MKNFIRQTAMLLAILFCCVYVEAQEHIDPDISREYLLKSVNLYKICKFTQWPGDKDTDDKFFITIIGQTVRGQTIQIPPGKKLKEKQVRIISVTDIEDINTPHVLFICTSEKNRLDEILQYTAGKCILTVGDSPGFSEAGVMINFYIDENTVKFEINVDAVNDTNLKLHSQLYRIGEIVNPLKSSE